MMNNTNSGLEDVSAQSIKVVHALSVLGEAGVNKNNAEYKKQCLEMELKKIQKELNDLDIEYNAVRDEYEGKRIKVNKTQDLFFIINSYVFVENKKENLRAKHKEKRDEFERFLNEEMNPAKKNITMQN